MSNNDLSDKVTKFSGTDSGNTYVTVDQLAYDTTNKKLGLKVNGADTVIPFSGESSAAFFGGGRGLFSARMQGQNLSVYDGNGKYLGTSATVKKAGTYTFSVAGTGSSSTYGSAMYISVNGTVIVGVGTGSSQRVTTSSTKYLNVGDVLRFYPSNADYGQTFDGIACVVLNG